MPILNYTTEVPVDRTIGEIHKKLVKAGASAIMSEYEGPNISHISFRVDHTSGPIHFRLPANVGGVEAALRKERQYKNDAHTRRVAWRILKDWVEAQLAIIEAQMAELPQVFLPYAQVPGGGTVYDQIKERGFLMLEGPKEG